MIRRWAVGLLLCLAGCSTRAAPAADGAGRDDLGRTDGAARPDRGTTCTLLQVAQATLDMNDNMKTTPALAANGDRFAVAWHTQPAPVSSMNGDLRLAVINSTGGTPWPDGQDLGSDNGVLEPALLTASGEYAVVHWSTASSGDGPVLRRVDPTTGKTLGLIPLGGTMTHAALAPHPSGLAVLAASPGDPRILIVDDSTGSVATSTSIITAQVMASLWLAPRTGGFVAGVFTTNKNATLYLLDPQMAQLAMGSVGHGALVQSPSFAVVPGGFASVYLSPAVEVEHYDDTGTRTGHQELGKTSASTTATLTARTALTWNGQWLVAAYPSPVPGQFLLRVLDAAGNPVGEATRLTGCLATSASIRLAWADNDNLLAVASLDHASGLPNSCICVTLLRCQ